ncbi:MAG TPA: MlaD family protein [Spirochaetota bacterium]|nr:MlaD family protein [Spirochaetota bacterium]HPJ37152.1 MlaD family protein [Spirochaetota bacterium]HPQ51693.1 MlaD family protein [Spirochaetota bacterium]
MKKEISVGIFFLIAMTILGYYTIIMTGEFLKSDQSYTVTVLFTNVEGLSEKDRVKINGVTAGKVTDIDLMDDSRVLVSLSMNRKFRLYKGYTIKIRSESTLGGRYVGINPGKSVVDDVANEEIHSREYLNGTALPDPLSMLSEFISENRENVYATIQNIRDITHKINSGQGTLGKLINDDRIHDNADGLVKELRDAIEDTREQAPITSFLRAALTAF